ncbi:Hypothetical_protein [Hexamita inflata]|uniref:Hypothetical_protein n=1 Tax=Hexamita inflata TaxID=28002 RepID=A0AA86R567_9EUKA|nr:Hypothetical protein HINF_LOCUS59346 [Hexamita inflata]
MVSALMQSPFKLCEVSQLLNDTQYWQQHIDSAPRWCFKVEQLQEYGFGSENYIQLLDMTLECSISVTEVNLTKNEPDMVKFSPDLPKNQENWGIPSNYKQLLGVYQNLPVVLPVTFAGKCQALLYTFQYLQYLTFNITKTKQFKNGSMIISAHHFELGIFNELLINLKRQIGRIIHIINNYNNYIFYLISFLTFLLSLISFYLVEREIIFKEFQIIKQISNFVSHQQSFIIAINYLQYTQMQHLQKELTTNQFNQLQTNLMQQFVKINLY